nr:MFS transporter [Roseospira navarrensis]
MAGGVLAAVHVGKVPPVLPTLSDDLGLGLIQGGFVVSTFYLLGMTLGLMTGVLADRLGRRRLVLAGLVSLCAGGAAGSLADGFAALLASRVLEGLGFMAVSVSSPALVVAASAPRDRPRTLALWSMFMPTGIALGLVAGSLTAAPEAWRGLWLAVAALTLAGTLTVTRMTRGLAAVHGPPPGSPWRVLGETLGRPRLLLLGAVFCAYAFQWIAVMVWLPTFLPAALGVGATTAALMTALVVIANVPGNYLGGRLLQRGVGLGRLVPGVSAVMALCAIGLFTEVLPPTARVTLVLVFSLTGGIIPAALFASAPARAASPGHLAAANGLLMQGSNIGQFLGPPLVAGAVTLAGGAWSGALAPVLTAAALTALAGVLAGPTGRS